MIFAPAMAAKLIALTITLQPPPGGFFFDWSTIMSRPVPAEVVTAAQASQRDHGCPASVCVAQWVQESAWGAKMSGKNNPFGIKATASQPATVRTTWEVINGKRVTIQARFRDFASLAEAFDAHGKLLATGSAYVEARKHLSDPRAYARALTGHYATDPGYGAALIAIMDGGNFYAFDVNPGAPDVRVSGPDVSRPASSVNLQPTFWQRVAAFFGLVASKPIG